MIDILGEAEVLLSATFRSFDRQPSLSSVSHSLHLQLAIMLTQSGLYILADTGTPEWSTDYTTLVLLHGFAWHSGKQRNP